jgi:peptidoglycan/xylan/chitin deacetylase (PgdA/CDA1 family)
MLKVQDVEEEIRHSKETIEDQLGSRVHSFAYPYAFPETNKPFKQTLEALLNQCGYENAVCTTIGVAARGESRFFMKRLPVNSDDDRRLLQAKLEGGYDWLGAVQYASKARPRFRPGSAGATVERP